MVFAVTLQLVMLGRIQFVGLKFGIFGGFEWVRSSIMVDKPGFRRVQRSVFLELGLGLASYIMAKLV